MTQTVTHTTTDTDILQNIIQELKAIFDISRELMKKGGKCVHDSYNYFQEGEGGPKIPDKYIITIYHEMFNSLSHNLEVIKAFQPV